MNRIITIGREFGSGGRELGKRLSDLLGVAYYDKEIILEISRRTQLAENYVNQIVEKKPGIFYPITVGRTLHNQTQDFMLHQYNAVYAEQANVLRDMAEKSDCIIVGRCADYILRENHPFRLFVYSDLSSRIERCRSRADEVESGLSDRSLKKMILRVDKARSKYYSYYTGNRWGDPSNYDLCVNTSGIPIKELAESLTSLISSLPKGED